LTLEEAVSDADAIIFLVAHDQFLNIIPEEFKNLYGNRILISAITGLNVSNWKSAGFTILQIGNGKFDSADW